MPALLEASLQVNPLFPPFCLVQAPCWILGPVRGGVSVHNLHAVDTVCPLLPEVTDQQIALMFRELRRLHYCMVFFLPDPASVAFVLFTVLPEYMRGPLRTWEGVKYLPVRSATLSRSSLWCAVTRPPILRSMA